MKLSETCSHRITTDMNIITRPYGSSRCYCRPDTTWERENKDLYVPEGIVGLEWAPIVFVKISKAGKCIGRKFASRYYDAFNFGVLLYCLHEDGEAIAFSSCADHSSLLPFPMYNPVVMENDGNIFEVNAGEELLFSMEMDREKLVGQIEDTICTASGTTSLRIGDFVAVELEPVSKLCSREDQEMRLKSTFCNNGLFDVRVIF